MPKPSTAVALPPIAKQVPAIIAEAEAIEIVDESSKEAATIILSTLNKKADAIEEEKAKVMRPLLDAQAAERARWKPAETILSTAIASLRRRLTDYQTAARAREAEEKARIAARVGEGRGHLTPETAIAKMEEVAVAEKKTVTDEGSLTFKTVQQFEVLDIKALPVEFLLPNDTAIRNAMKKGQQLPGVRYYTEEVPINRR